MSKSNTFETEQLTDAVYYILLSLVEERHGYAIMKFIEDTTNKAVSMGPGTLYTLLKKLVTTGFIVQMAMDDDRTKKYKITQQGLSSLKKEIKRRQYMVEDGIKIVYGGEHGQR